MSSPLPNVPVERRKRLAATLGLFAMLFVAVGLVANTGPGTIAIRSFVVVALVIGVVLALMAWGVASSVRSARREQRIDEAIEAAVAASPGGFASMCDCGHEHDPTELHITDAEPDASCGHDGAGAQCSHDCDTCVLTRLRPSPVATRSERLTG